MASSSKCYIEPIQCKNKEVYQELNTLILEYLEVNGLEQALQTFTKECQVKNLPCPKAGSSSTSSKRGDVKAAFSHYDGEHLLKSFDDGDLDCFLKLWKHFQTHIQVTSEDMKKLEVYLRVHFAIWPKAHGQSETKQNQAMQSLKQFFEEHSAQLSSDATILPLFALPFVPDPRTHPIFKDLFQETWTTKLRAQLETTVNKYFELLQENITTHCKLASVVAKHGNAAKHISCSNKSLGSSSLTPSARRVNSSTGNSGAGGIRPQNATVNTSVSSVSTKNGNNPAVASSLLKMSESAMAYHQERFLQLVSVQRKTRKVLRGVRENYQKLLNVCSELINALEKSVSDDQHKKSSEPVRLDAVIQQCFHIFPEIFTNPERLSSGSQPDIGHFKKLASTPIFKPLDSEVSLLFLGILDVGPATLNYNKIKDDLMSDRVPLTEKLCLMQALRWMITKTSADARGHCMEHFVDNDVLGLNSNRSETLRHKLFACLLSPNPSYQKESLARLINAFASTWNGRNYLTSSDYVIDILIKSLSTFRSQQESFICHMVIATLQKLSLRKSMRRTMIEQNVIPWLVKYIKMELDRDLIRDEVQQMQSEWVVNEQQNNNNKRGSTVSITSNFYGESFNNYLMEYAWALLMNLCLHDEAINSALSVDFEFLHCIVTMLTNKASFEFTPYVLSTLFSLLRNPELFEKAKTMSLDKKLGPLIAQQTGEVANHLRHLLTQMYETENVDRLTASGETDYDDTDNPDPDEVESELELPESWMNIQTDTLLTGDDLLIRRYLLNNKIKAVTNTTGNDITTAADSNNSCKKNATSNSVDSKKATTLILRPITPTTNNSKSPRNNAVVSVNNNNPQLPEVSSKSKPRYNQQQTNNNSPLQQNPRNQKQSDGSVSTKKEKQCRMNPLLHQEFVVNTLIYPEQRTQQELLIPKLVPVDLNASTSPGVSRKTNEIVDSSENEWERTSPLNLLNNNLIE